MQFNQVSSLPNNSVAMLLNPDQPAMTHSDQPSKTENEVQSNPAKPLMDDKKISTESALASVITEPQPSKIGQGKEKMAPSSHKSHNNTSPHSNGQNQSIYIYTQHKTRLNAPFDLSHVHCQKIIHDTRIASEGTIKGIKYTVQEGSIPTIVIDRSDKYPTPYELYAIMEPLGKQFGAVKIDFGNCDDPLFASFGIDTENFWFKPRKQHSNSYNIELQKRVKLHYDLYRFHKLKKDPKKNSTLGKIPSIDKRTLDLHRLRSCVQSRGGFENVCQKKLWAQIGRELGYSGRIMSSLSTSLRSAYIKMFSDFDKQEESSQLSLDTTTSPADSIEIPQEKFYTTGKRDTDYAQIKDRNASTSDQHLIKRQCTEKILNFELGGSGKEYFRMRDILDAKGFSTRYGSVVEPKIGITEPNDSTYPDYNFNLWNRESEIYDNSLYEWRSSPIYNLKQYFEKSQRHREMIQESLQDLYPSLSSYGDAMSIEDFERLYQTIIQEESLSFDIETGLDLPTIVHGSGFVNLAAPTSNTKPRTLHPWDLNTINLCKESLLQYLDIDYGNLCSSKIDIGMLFSTSGWAVEDGLLPVLDYSHVGSSKVWYFVPPQYKNRMESLFEDIKQKIPKNDVEKYEADFIESDFFQSFQATNLLDQNKTSRKRTINNSLLDIVGIKPDIQNPHNDIQVHTSSLSSAGIRYFKVVQEPKTFIMKYPQVYSTTIHSGFQISEKSLFAPKEWLNNLEAVESWRSHNNLLPSVLPFQLLVNISENSSDNELIRAIQPLLIKSIKEELQLRNKIEKNIPHVINKFDFISDIDLSPTGASKMVISNESNSISISITQYLELEPKFTELQGLNIELHEYYTESFLTDLLIKLQNDPTNRENSIPYETTSLLDMINNLKCSQGSGPKISINDLSNLLISIPDENLDEKSIIKEFINEAQMVTRGCKSIIERTRVPKITKICHDAGFLTKRILPPEFEVGLEDLHNLLRKIRELPVSIDYSNDIARIVTSFAQFQKDAALYRRSNQIEILEKIYTKGLSLGINSKYLQIYAERISQLQWLKVYDMVFGNDKRGIAINDISTFQAHDVFSFLSLGVDLFGDDEIDKLENIAKEIAKLQWITNTVQKLLIDKSHRIKSSTLQELVNTSNSVRIPLSSKLLDQLSEINKTIGAARNILLPMHQKLSINDQWVSEFQSAVRNRTAEQSQVVNRFNGSANDLRLTQADALRNLESPLYSKHIKATKAWQHDFNNVFNSVSQSLQAVMDRAKRCWSPLDKFDNPEETRRHCFCRQVDNGDVMVECEICNEWYDFSCINQGKWVLPEDDSTVFCCEICLHRPLEKNYQGPTFDQIQRLIIESAKIKIVPDKTTISNLFDLYELCCNYRNMVEQILLEPHNCKLIKFYLRKIIGAGISMPELCNKLLVSCKSQDETKIQEILRNKTKIVSGYPSEDTLLVNQGQEQTQHTKAEHTSLAPSSNNIHPLLGE